jgi:plastocyanin
MAILLYWWLTVVATMASTAAAHHSHDTTEVVVTKTEGDDGRIVTITTIEDDITTPPVTRPTTTATSITTHTINVGAVGHKFTPGETKAAVGDVIEWRFYPAEHWVIRADYDWPCIPYNYVGLNRQSFSSGLQVVNAITDDVGVIKPYKHAL